MDDQTSGALAVLGWYLLYTFYNSMEGQASARYYGALLSLNSLARSPSGDLLVQVVDTSAFPLMSAFLLLL